MRFAFVNMPAEFCDRPKFADVFAFLYSIGRDTRISQRYFKPAVASADAAVIITPCPEFAEISPQWIDHGRTPLITNSPLARHGLQN
jgi:hypothetical protein